MISLPVIPLWSYYVYISSLIIHDANDIETYQTLSV